MLKKFPILIVLTVLALVSCGPGRLTRADLTIQQDKKFYVTEVSIKETSNRDFFVKGLGIEKTAFKKMVYSALPVEGIVKGVSDELKISIDSSEYKAAVPGEKETGWKSDKKDINQVKITYTLTEAKAANGFMAIGLRLTCNVDIIAADGKTWSVVISSPENSKQCFTPERIAQAKKIPVEEIVKLIILEEFKTLPAKVAQSLKKY